MEPHGVSSGRVTHLLMRGKRTIQTVPCRHERKLLAHSGAGLACITGALRAKRGEGGILREAQRKLETSAKRESRGGEKESFMFLIASSRASLKMPRSPCLLIKSACYAGQCRVVYTRSKKNTKPPPQEMIAFAYEERFELQLTVSKMDSIRDRPQLSVLYYRGVGFIYFKKVTWHQ